MQLEHLVREKKFVEENRARACIRACVICMFYTLSIGGFRMSAHFFVSLRLTSVKTKEKVLAVRVGGSGGPDVLAKSLEQLYYDS